MWEFFRKSQSLMTPLVPSDFVIEEDFYEKEEKNLV